MLLSRSGTAKRCARAEKEARQENGDACTPAINTTISLCMRQNWVERLQVLLQWIPTTGTKKNLVFHPQRMQSEEELLFDPVVVCTGDKSNVRTNGYCLLYHAPLMERTTEHLDYVLRTENIKAPDWCSARPTPADPHIEFVTHQGCRLRMLRQFIDI